MAAHRARQLGLTTVALGLVGSAAKLDRRLVCHGEDFGAQVAYLRSQEVNLGQDGVGRLLLQVVGRTVAFDVRRRFTYLSLRNTRASLGARLAFRRAAQKRQRAVDAHKDEPE